MKKLLLSACATVLMAGSALAAGELHIYNWGDYTSPEMIKKFEAAYGVKVTIDSYDSNETMLSKVRAGNSGYDIVVPSDYTVKIMVACSKKLNLLPWPISRTWIPVM
jgi:spermidine/putrescine transport system substrate-binding protein